MTMLVAATALAATLALPSPDGEVIQLRVSDGRPRVALRHLPARGTAPRGVVLFVHGATFPSALSFAYPVEGRSWMRELADAGFDAWALDFANYGDAERDRRMSEEATANPPIGRAREVLPQIREAVRFIRERQRGQRVSIVAHSWGTIPAAMFVSAHPERVAHLVMYGPVVARQENEEGPGAAWVLSDREQQWQSFLAGVPEGRMPAIERAAFDVWFERYLASDPTRAERAAPSVKVPAGPIADHAAALSGTTFYEPAAITVPTLVLRGEWDAVTTARDATQLFEALTSAPLKRMVWISGGTHRMHLETSRRQLYREVRLFLEESEMGR